MPQIQNNDPHNFPKERAKGIIGTLLFHVILFTMLLITGLATPLPLPEEEGILVNFGSGDTGDGFFEPAASSSSQSSSSEQLPDYQITPPTTKQVEAAATEKQILTQDFEEAAVVKKETKIADPNAELKKKQALEEQKKIERQREEDRIIRREIEEKERVARETAAAEAKKAAEEEAMKQEIIDRARNAFTTNAAAGTGTNKSQGVAGGTGNQGRETGSIDSDIYGEGKGTGTRGISYNLLGRTHTKIPSPTYDIQKEGKVVVEVTVNRSGKVTDAVPGVKGSTTLDEYFLKVAKDAAMAATFDAKPDAPIFQKGTITYIFTLN